VPNSYESCPFIKSYKSLVLYTSMEAAALETTATASMCVAHTYARLVAKRIHCFCRGLSLSPSSTQLQVTYMET